MTSNMKISVTGMGIVVLASLAAVFALSPMTHRQSIPTKNIAAVDRMITPKAGSPPPAIDAIASRKLEPVGYAHKYQQSHNYLEFVRSAIDAANAGDANAQYYLGRALLFCSDGGGPYLAYFQKKGKLLSLDEALQNSAALHRSNGFTQSIYDRCHDLREQGTEFGTASEWLTKAADAGQPAAQSTVALTVMSDEAFKAAAGSAPPSSDKMADARAQLLAAVETKDPQAIWEAGEAQGFLNQSFSEKVKNLLAWRLVSCQRGLDCSPDADWVQLDCRVDSYCAFGVSGVDYIRNAAVAESDLPAIEQLAQDINAKLDAGQWDSLGLGP